LKKNRAAVPQLKSNERQDIFLSMFLLNHCFHGIVLRLDELAGLLGRKNLRDMRGLTQEVQTEINHLILSKLESIEERDWAQFGKVRTAMEKRLSGPPRKRRKR
jgi:hypothetical protein